ncbi:hypothetical protein [Anaeromyxobacter diazotrophicus]|uniref:Uncharacterized protein n=1 Tax=Anaeromyxobacter diazotrophicus TaxID=2590199 RepID=A0A7I9VM26_9BACT|nr:hypothetical protein [Anaeromyxobacter diazotrophicus]GEJ57462.1 hypothetical protein AMYX_22030 [Anaeromyxobacter diazotrophicus]
MAAGKAKGAKGASARARDRATPPRPALAPGFDAPLHELDRDALSIFLYLALLPEETAQLVKAMNLSQPGFRQEALGEVQRCDLLADELRAVPERRAEVLEALRKGLERPVLPSSPLSPAEAVDLVDACMGEDALALALWRVLADPDPAVRAEARPFLARLAAHYYGPAQEAGAPRPAPEADPLAALERERAELGRKLEEAQRRLEQAEARGESARRKGEEAREKLQAWLKDARAREAQAVEEAARARGEAAGAQRERARLEEELQAARRADAAVEAQRLRRALDDAEARAGALEGRLERARERERELAAELEKASQAARESGAAAQEGRLPRAEVPAAEAEPEEAPATWLMPVYTREFYDSLEGWDRRVQRAAFKQAALLAQDHRHGSLRALPLEGLPGYYRVRVATDVRLLYRRTERQNTIEILSLIDREDLDRYIKQAKTRS